MRVTGVCVCFGIKIIWSYYSVATHVSSGGIMERLKTSLYSWQLSCREPKN